MIPSSSSTASSSSSASSCAVSETRVAAIESTQIDTLTPVNSIFPHNGNYAQTTTTTYFSTDSNTNNIINNNLYATNVNSSDFGQYFVSMLLPHVKSFAYTWFHLQAAKRKHFKNEDKRMKYEEELELKTRLMNEQQSVKIKWAARLLMKIRKDVEKISQKDLIDVIKWSRSLATNVESSSNEKNKCVVSNPDMKGKMRRIDCLRQSDKVWRLDLVMVVLFKGIPLESSDGERIDKLPECQNPQLCINPNHALINVRDLEVFLANYINNSNLKTNSQDTLINEVKLYCTKNIVSPSVFTPQEFMGLSEVSIVNGASEPDIKNSLSFVATNSHFLDINDEVESSAVNLLNQANSDLDDKDLIRNLINSNSIERKKEENNNLFIEKASERSKKSKTVRSLNEGPIKINELMGQIKHDKLSARDEETRLLNNNLGMTTTTTTSNNVLESSSCHQAEAKLTTNIDFELTSEKQQGNKDLEQQTNKKNTKTVKKTVKNELAVSGSGGEAASENNSPAKATIKRRRSSQKNNVNNVTDSNGLMAENEKKCEKTKVSNKKNLKIKEYTIGSPSKTNNKKRKENYEELNDHQEMKRNKLAAANFENNNNSSNIQAIEDQSSCSTSSLQDDEIKELLMKKTNFQIQKPQQDSNQKESNHKGLNISEMNKNNSIRAMLNSPSTMSQQQQQQQQMRSQFNSSLSFEQNTCNKIIADELKELIQKEKQTTTDLFLHILKAQEDNQNSNETIFNELTTNNNTNMLLNGSSFIQTINQQQQHQQLQQQQQQQQQHLQHHQLKSTTPVFELLMSPLFNTIIPSSGSCSNSSTTSSASSSSSSSSSTNNSNNQNNLISNSFNQFSAVNVASAAAAALSAAISLNKTPPTSSPTCESIKQSSFKRTKEKSSKIKDHCKIPNAGNHSNRNSPIKLNNNNNNNNINSSLINALRFDSNVSLDDLINLTNSTNSSDVHLVNIQQKLDEQHQILINKIISSSPTLNNQRPSSSLDNKITQKQNSKTRANENIDDEELNKHQNSNKSPPPPPSITTSVINSSITAPSPTKLLQFYPYAQSSTGHIMHRPIPIIQKSSDNILSNEIVNASNNNNNNNNSGDSKLTLVINNVKGDKNEMSKTPSDMSELTKISQQQQQFLSSLRSNSASNNSPLMFSINSNGINYNGNNNSNQMTNNNNTINITMNNGNINNFMSSFTSNSANIFANYPNISPANGMNGTFIGGNGNASPTSSLFPSITSLFQSPIGTPRVTPTPQQFAAYLFNDDQFHSLIFPSSSMPNNNNSGNSSESYIEGVLSNQNNLTTTTQSFQQLPGSTSTNHDLSTHFQNLITTNHQINGNASPSELNKNSSLNQSNENQTAKQILLIPANN